MNHAQIDMYGFEHNASSFHYFNALPEEVTKKEARADTPFPTPRTRRTGSAPVALALRRVESSRPMICLESSTRMLPTTRCYPHRLPRRSTRTTRCGRRRTCTRSCRGEGS